MSYQDMAGWSQIIAMTIFGIVMAGALVYALLPGNREKFDAAARLPLLADDDQPVFQNTRPSPKRDQDGEGGRHGLA